MNSMANGDCSYQNIFESFFVPASPGDSGGSIGAALSKFENSSIDETMWAKKLSDYLTINFNKVIIDPKIFKINIVGSPFPGAIACLMKIILPPFFSALMVFSDEKA